MPQLGSLAVATTLAGCFLNVVSDRDLPHGDTPDPRTTLARTESKLTAMCHRTTRHYRSRSGCSGACAGSSDPFGYSYFRSNPEVSADLITMIRYGLRPNEPGRPLIEVSRPLWRVIPPEQRSAN